MADATSVLRMRQAEAAFFANYLRVLIEWDARASVRIQQRGAVIGVWGAPPTECVSFIALPLSSAGEPLDAITDRTVSAGRMRDCLGDVTARPRGFAGRSINVPEPVSGPIELMRLPPKSDWEPGMTGTADHVSPIIDAAIAEFRARVPEDRNIERAQRVADEIWSRPGWSGVPIRALHTAKSLGFLAKPDAPVQALKHPGWSRFITPAGQVFSPEEIGTLSLRLPNLN